MQPATGGPPCYGLVLWLLIPAFSGCARHAVRTVPNDLPALKAQAVKFEFQVEQYRKGVKPDYDESTQNVLDSLVSLYTKMGDAMTAKKYESERAELKARHPEILHRPEDSFFHERINEFEAKLKEFRAGQRDYRDAFLILRGLIHWHTLREDDDARRYQAELEDLQKRHPDLLTDMPMLLSEERARRSHIEAARVTSEKLEEARRKIEKQYPLAGVAFRFQNRVAVQDEEGIHFFIIPEHHEVYFVDLDAEGRPWLRKIQPGVQFGRLTFCADADIEYHPPSRDEAPGHLGRVSACRAQKTLAPEKTIAIRAPVALQPEFTQSRPGQYILLVAGAIQLAADSKEERDFVGVLSIEGDILFRFSPKLNAKQSVVWPVGIIDEGPAAVVGIGEWLGEEYGPWPEYPRRNYRQLLVWTYPDKIETIDVAEGGERLAAISRKFGITAHYAPPDTTPPLISGIRVSTAYPNLGIIEWATNETTTGIVEFGTSPAYGLHVSAFQVDPNRMTAHLTGLASLTTYYFRIKCEDRAGNKSASKQHSLATTAPQHEFQWADVPRDKEFERGRIIGEPQVVILTVVGGAAFVRSFAFFTDEFSRARYRLKYAGSDSVTIYWHRGDITGPVIAKHTLTGGPLDESHSETWRCIGFPACVDYGPGEYNVTVQGDASIELRYRRAWRALAE